MGECSHGLLSYLSPFLWAIRRRLARVRIVYSFNKRGAEAEFWAREIAGASTDEVQFIPFNHDPYVEPTRYIRAQLLDNLYYEREPGLERLYGDMAELLRAQHADVLLVDNGQPYHPEFLRNLPVYKVLRVADGPLGAYDRDFAYFHAYHHVLYHSPAYSRDLGMAEKLAYCGCRNADLWPLALFDAVHDPALTEDTLFARDRDIDVVFVGALFLNKMPMLAAVKKALGPRFVLRGLSSWKKNAYFNAKFGFPGWVRPIEQREYVPLYQRAKIGINVHNRGKYTVGSYRLFELPANGVMQLSDGDEYLETFYEPGGEIVGYSGSDDLIDKLTYYLEHDAEREAIARAGYRRVIGSHRIAQRLHEAVRLIKTGMTRTGHTMSLAR